MNFSGVLSDVHLHTRQFPGNVEVFDEKFGGCESIRTKGAALCVLEQFVTKHSGLVP
jgi:hypothetical protein